MNTNVTGFLNGFQKSLCHCSLDKSSLSIGRVMHCDSTELGSNNSDTLTVGQQTNYFDGRIYLH